MGMALPVLSLGCLLPFYPPRFPILSAANGHGKCAALNNETRDARFPLPLDKTTSHSTKLQKTAAKSLVTPQAVEGDKVSLREFHFINSINSYYALSPNLSLSVQRKAREFHSFSSTISVTGTDIVQSPKMEVDYECFRHRQYVGPNAFGNGDRARWRSVVIK